MRIRTAILPIAGKGTRVMPLTLHQPKAMIGIADKPMIHYLIDEILAAGIKHIILVVAPDQKSIFENYLNFLRQNQKWKHIGVKIDIATQPKPRGNGDALLPAQKFVKKNEKAFLVAFVDDVIPLRHSPLKNLINNYNKFLTPVLLLEKIPKAKVSSYGVVKIIKKFADFYQIEDIVEKPKPEKAPSNFAIIGRYILPSSIFGFIKRISKSSNPDEEIYLTDAINLYLQKHRYLNGLLFKDVKFDAGSKLGLLKANAYFGAHHKEFKNEFRKYIKKLANNQ